MNKADKDLNSRINQLERLYAETHRSSSSDDSDDRSSHTEHTYYYRETSSTFRSFILGLSASSILLGGGMLTGSPLCETASKLVDSLTHPGSATYSYNVGPEYGTREYNLHVYPWAYGLDPHAPGSAEKIHAILQEGIINVPKATITGIVDAQSMTSSLYWTLVLKNNNNVNKEAAIVVDLPANSAVSRATLWINGVAQEATFSAKEQVQAAYDRIVVNNRDPLLVTQVGPNRIKIQASPVTAGGGEMKLRIGITAPIEVVNGKNTITLPRIAESNLHFDNKQDIHLNSDTRIAGLGTTDHAGDYVLRANVPIENMKTAKITVGKSSGATTFASRLTHTYPQEYVVGSVVDGELTLKRTTERPSVGFINDTDVAFRLSNLWAHQAIERWASRGEKEKACELANTYRIVSSVSSAAVLETEEDYNNFGLNRDMYKTTSSASADAFDSTAAMGGSSNGAPMLMGATNGTIGPQGSDATVISGINTAGTVRVNNLYNFELLLNLLAYTGQLIGILFSVFFASEAIQGKGLKWPVKLSKNMTLTVAVVVALAAFCLPQFIDYLVCSMRDINVFS